jgi:hypothetical protein
MVITSAAASTATQSQSMTMAIHRISTIQFEHPTSNALERTREV